MKSWLFLALALQILCGTMLSHVQFTYTGVGAIRNPQCLVQVKAHVSCMICWVNSSKGRTAVRKPNDCELLSRSWRPRVFRCCTIHAVQCESIAFHIPEG